MAYKSLTTLMLPVLLAGCATTARMMGMPLKQTQDEEAILGVFSVYLLLTSSSSDAVEKEPEEPEAEESCFLARLFEKLFKALDEFIAKSVNEEIREQLSRDHGALCELFDVETDAELDVWFVADSLHITYPATCADARRRRGLIDYFDLSWRERGTWGAYSMFNVRSDIADGLERPEAKLTFDIYFAPPGSVGDDPPGMANVPEVFKQRRTLHLVKSEDWVVVHDARGGDTIPISAPGFSPTRKETASR